jgi:Sec7-like guanine-nucleotide exchange factor
MSFGGLAFDVALRLMLTRAGFRLPGEAQKIDRITRAFAVTYFEQNRPAPAAAAAAAAAAVAAGEGLNASRKGPRAPSIAFADGRLFPGTVDVIEVLSFSTIMLNTDAHNPSIKREKRMTKEQFVSNNRGIDNGGNLPRFFLEHL